jgi:hypothetical protein
VEMQWDSRTVKCERLFLELIVRNPRYIHCKLNFISIILAAGNSLVPCHHFMGRNYISHMIFAFSFTLSLIASPAIICWLWLYLTSSVAH